MGGWAGCQPCAWLGLRGVAFTCDTGAVLQTPPLLVQLLTSGSTLARLQAPSTCWPTQTRSRKCPLSGGCGQLSNAGQRLVSRQHTLIKAAGGSPTAAAGRPIFLCLQTCTRAVGVWLQGGERPALHHQRC